MKFMVFNDDGTVKYQGDVQSCNSFALVGGPDVVEVRGYHFPQISTPSAPAPIYPHVHPPRPLQCQCPNLFANGHRADCPEKRK
jgi:hypothetical protein